MEPGGERCCITVVCGVNRLASVCCINDATHHGTGSTFEAERDVASQWSAERIGQQAFVASTMQHSTEAGAGPLLRGEKMLHHSGQNEKVSERLLHQRCNTVLKRGRAHFGGGKRCCITVLWNVTGR